MFKSRITFISIFLSFSILHSTASSQTLSIEPEIEHFKYASVEKIPSGTNLEIDGNCEAYVLETNFKFNQSSVIKDAGWVVLSESELAAYKLVAFAGALHNSTSGTCLIEQSNIAIYHDNTLLGIIYLDDPMLSKIGNLVLTDAGYVRIFSGDVIQMPVAELHLSKDGINLRSLSPFTSHCNGKAILPNLIGQNILSARSQLFSFGFTPVVSDTSSIPSWREGLITAGVAEVAACSGTGFAFCAFNYQNKASRVRLITAGEAEIPTVVREIIECQ